MAAAAGSAATGAAADSAAAAVLVASHDLYLLEHFPVRRVRLEGGKIVDQAEAAEAALLDPAALLDDEDPT